MRIYHILTPYEIFHNREMHMNTICVLLNNGNVLTCEKFPCSQKEKLKLIIWLSAERKWVKTYAKNEYTEMIWQYYFKLLRKSRCKVNVNQCMKHDRIHKKGSGGSRLGNNGIVTDYECSKNPLHDFRRAMYVQWN